MWNLKKLNIKLLYNLAIPWYPEKSITGNDICIPLVTVALLTVAQTQQPPKCPAAEDWIKTVWYIYTMECYLDITNNNNAICYNTDGPRDSHTSEVT